MVGLSLLIAAASTVLPPLWVFISMALIVNIRTQTANKAVQQINAKDADSENAEPEKEAPVSTD